jgi:hypothetical protein
MYFLSQRQQMKVVRGILRKQVIVTPEGVDNLGWVLKFETADGTRRELTFSSRTTSRRAQKFLNQYVTVTARRIDGRLNVDMIDPLYSE